MTATPPRVAFVNHSAEPGGGELALFDLVRATPDARVILFSDGPFAGMLRDIGIEPQWIRAGAVLDIRRTDSLPAIAARMPALAGLTLRLAKSLRHSDVVYANSQKAFIAAALAAPLARRPLIWHLHDILTEAHFSGTVRRAAIALGNRFAEGVIANSTATATAYRDAGGTRPVEVIHNGIDPRPFAALDRDRCRNALATAIGSGAAPILGVFGRIAPWKGQHVAIDALAHVPDVHLVLVGGALFGEDDHDAALRRQVADAGLQSRVHFLGFRSDIPALMSGVDIALHCSTAPEPFGRVIVEAMMAEVPVIATAAGGALEIVEDGRTGLLVAPGDSVSLAAAVRTLLDDTARAAQLASAGRAAALSRFSLDASVSRIHAAIAATRRVPGRSIRG
jgi:glycosyltransferase involved in cell wall biosynthesis